MLQAKVKCLVFQMNQILPTSHRQAEMMIPDSQSCMPSSTASAGGYTDHIKMVRQPDLNYPTAILYFIFS